MYNPPPERALPPVPGMNASAMGMARTIGHTPWRANAPHAATTRPRKNNAKSRNGSRAARAARTRARNRV
jgi:hypothetical protein